MKKPKAKVREQVEDIDNSWNAKFNRIQEVNKVWGRIHVSALHMQWLLDQLVIHSTNDPQAAIEELAEIKAELKKIEKWLERMNSL